MTRPTLTVPFTRWLVDRILASACRAEANGVPEVAARILAAALAYDAQLPR